MDYSPDMVLQMQKKSCMLVDLLWHWTKLDHYMALQFHMPIFDLKSGRRDLLLNPFWILLRVNCMELLLMKSCLNLSGDGEVRVAMIYTCFSFAIFLSVLDEECCLAWGSRLIDWMGALYQAHTKPLHHPESAYAHPVQHKTIICRVKISAKRAIDPELQAIRLSESQSRLMTVYIHIHKSMNPYRPDIAVQSMCVSYTLDREVSMTQSLHCGYWNCYVESFLVRSDKHQIVYHC